MHKPWYHIFYVNSPIAKLLWGTLALGATLLLLAFQWNIEEPRMTAQTESWDGRSIEQGAAIFSSNCASCHGVDGKGLAGVAPALNSHYFFTQRLTDLGYTGTLLDYVEGTVASGRPSNAISQWAQKMPTWADTFGGPLRPDQVHNVALFVLNWEDDALAQTAADDPWQPFENAVTSDISATAEGGADAAPAGDARAPDLLFTSMGCGGCHMEFPTADQTADNHGPVAPYLGNIDERAGSTVPGEDALTYVHNSIADPNAHIAEGYMGPPSAMPANFSVMMSDAEITALSQWVLDQAAAN